MRRPASRRLRRPRRPLLAVAVAAATVLAAGCGGGSGRPAYDVAPSWHPPAVGPASAAAFCEALDFDFHHLTDAAGVRTTHDLEADYAGFFAAAPAAAAAAPPAIAPAAHLFLTTSVDLYKALLQKTIDHARASSALTRELNSKATAAAVSEVEAYASTNCHPDPL